MYRSENWAVTKEHRFRVFYVERGMCELKKWNYIMRSFLFCKSSRYSISVITWRRMQWVGYVVYVGEVRNLYKILVGKRDGQRTPGIPVIGG
jgi:hypothetical protein